MPLLAWGASELILGIVLTAVGALAFWLVGHTVERDISALGDAAGGVLDKAGSNVGRILNPGVLVAVIAVAYLATRKGK